MAPFLNQRGSSFIRKPPRHIAVPGHAISGLQLAVTRAWLPVHTARAVILLTATVDPASRWVRVSDFASIKEPIRVAVAEGRRAIGCPRAPRSRPKRQRLRFHVRRSCG